MTEYTKMNVTLLREKLAERGLQETGLKTKDQYIQRLLEDDQRIFEKQTSRRNHIVKSKGLLTIPRLSCNHAN
jgi:hypothetical protein